MGKCIRVLVADDEEPVRLLLARVLSQRGWRVTVAADGQEALGLLTRSERFDIVITDFSMPKANGLEVLRFMHNRFPDAKGILISGQLLDGDRRKELEELAHTFLPKPFATHELSKVLDHIAV